MWRNGNCHFISNYFRLCNFQVTEDHAEFESNTSLRKQQYNFIRNAGFTKRPELGKQMYLTLQPKFFKPYERNTLKISTNLCNILF